MNKLNNKQLRAVQHVGSPLLVLAGAGSGKTRVITQKIAYLIRHCGYSAWQIAAVTFTNKAAREMKSRVQDLLDRRLSRGLTVSTFHTLGLKLIRAELKACGLRKNFTIYDSNDSKTLIQEILQQQLNSDELAAELVDDAARYISQWKNDCLLPHQITTEAVDNPAITDIIRNAYEQYYRQLQDYNAVDFDDLILIPVMLLRQNPNIRAKWQKKIRYLLIDEYQDTNTAQYQLVKLLTTRGDSPAWSNHPPSGLTVVGDDDQSIYCWRGARPENLATLEQDYPDLVVVKLEQNYRSTGRILKAANELIKNNPHVFEKKLWSDLEYGEKIKVIEAGDEHQEVELVVASIVREHFNQQRSYADFAILYRGNFQSRLFEKQLRLQQIPYQITGGPSFFSHTEIKDILAYIRVLVNHQDDGAFLRIVNTPRRQIGPATIEKLCLHARQLNKSLLATGLSLSLQACMETASYQRLQKFCLWLQKMQQLSLKKHPVRLLRQLIEEIDYYSWLVSTSESDARAQRRIDNVEELLLWLERIYDLEQDKHNEDGQSPELSDLLNRMILMNILENNEKEKDQNCVSLMTLHSAKGLEFPVVYMIGMEEELLPHRSALEEDNVEEERRLCYVGITRARKQLILTYTAKRKRYGEETDTTPSRFLYELPEDDLKWIRGREKVSQTEAKQIATSHIAQMRQILEQSR